MASILPGLILLPVIFFHQTLHAGRLDGKIIITNTTTPEDVADLKERGLAMLITTTPVLDVAFFRHHDGSSVIGSIGKE